jgi:multimeric flavodoxin WrbA
MRLSVFNDSPRGDRSTTRILLQHFLDGFMITKGNSYEVFNLNRIKEGDRFVKAFRQAEHVLLAFPLYHDSMPAMVKTFIETLGPFCGHPENPKIGFIVQSGFPEAIHSRYIEQYLEKLSKRLGSEYLGTIIKGNANLMDEQPGFVTKNVFKSFRELGRVFGETGQFDERILAKLATPERLSGVQGLMFRLALKTGLGYLGWRRELHKNNAFAQRFAKPYSSD